jgi:putative ABC transport system permease protein
VRAAAVKHAMFDTLRQDVLHAVRGLIKSPGFAAASLITLALGIGATSAIFSVVKAVLMTPLPYAAPEQTVQLFARWVSFDKTWLSNQEVVDFRNMAKTLTAVASWNTGQQNLTGDGEPLRVGVGFVTANLFDVLGARPMLGRTITAAEDAPNGPQVAVLGYPLWQARFGSDAAVVGRTVMINDVPVEVIGVMPEGFRLPTDFTDDAAEPTQLWRPIQWDMANLIRGNHGFFGVATLAPGQTAASATAELHAISTRLTEQGAYPAPMRFTAFAVPLEDEIRGGVRPAMWLLMGAVGFLLLIACANVANLLLVRGDARLREMAVRTAIGAAPDRLVRQLLTESIVLALLGAVLGLGLASIGLRALMTIDPTSLPPLAPVRLDWTVVSFTLVLAVITTIVFGLAPALRTLRVNLVESLREGGQATVGGHRQRLRSLLVVAEVTLAVVLVIGAALMVKSLAALGRIDLGFTPDNMLTMRVSVPAARYDTPEKVVDFFRQLNDKVRALPGVESAGFVRVLPLATTIGDFGLDVDGFVETPGSNAKGDWQIATDGSFEAMGARLMRGRWFAPSDTSNAQAVAVINETMARTYWKNPDDAVGGQIRIGSQMDRPWLTVVGMVADERHNGVTGIVKEKFYVPHSQWHVATSGNLIRGGFLVVRSTGDPMAVAGAVRSQIRALDPNIPVANIRPMTEVVSASLATPRLTGFLMGTFAAIALTLAAVGIYGVLSYLVARRTHEIGIRLAVGANRMQVLAMVLKQGLTLAGIGIVTGLAAALALTRLMQSLLYQVRPSDPETFVLVSIALIGVAVLASALPAYRATKVSPLVALRTE